METHITHKRPTIRQRFLSIIGLGALPTKVNCWYCSQDSYIFPGSKNTADHWYCNLCENINKRDANGEIIDPDPNITRKSEDVPVTKRSPSATTNNNANTLCTQCQENQVLIYQYLSEYLPDESDPTYKQKYNSMDKYKRDLHRRYRLCDNCQKKIKNLVEEQKAALRVHAINEAISNSEKGDIPSKPSMTKLHLQGLFWFITHISTIAFAVYSIVYPPQKGTPFSFQLPRALNDIPPLDDIWDMLVSNIKDYIYSCRSIITSAYDCISSDQNEKCQWVMDDWVPHCVVVVLVSYQVKSWHHLLGKYFVEELKRWEFYKKAQNLLLPIRLALILEVAYTCSPKLIVSTLIIYILVAFIPYVAIRAENPSVFWRVGRLCTSIEEESEEEKVTADQGNVEPMDLFEDDDMSILQEPGHAMGASDIDAIDNIANGIDSMRF